MKHLFGYIFLLSFMLLCFFFVLLFWICCILSIILESANAASCSARKKEYLDQLIEEHCQKMACQAKRRKLTEQKSISDETLETLACEMATWHYRSIDYRFIGHLKFKG